MDPPPTEVATEAFPAAMPAAPAAPAFSDANPSLSFGPIPSHPPYAEMIMAAITALKEKDGSSKKAIAKYIEGAYPNLPPAHPALLTHHLKRLKNSGQLVMMKKSYMLPPPPGSGSDFAPALPTATASTANFTSFPASKKRPGRPPKPKSFGSEYQPAAGGIFDPSTGLGNGRVVSPKRGPGRPPKTKAFPTAAVDQLDQQQQPPPTVYPAQPISSNAAALGDSGLVNGMASLSKRRGRPPKAWSELSGGGRPASAKRGPGRPPKFAVGGARPRGRPRKSGGLVAGAGARGRPRKRAAVAVDGGIAPMGMKRRGRPPGSVTGARKLGIGRTGRPLGRPRKASGEAERRASEELTRKLEYMQLKVRSAVGLLKPHLINANIIDILTALQDLEELATMDITTPTTTAAVTAPIPEPTPAVMADPTPQPIDISAPAVDVTAPPFADPGVVGQLPVTFN